MFSIDFLFCPTYLFYNDSQKLLLDCLLIIDSNVNLTIKTLCKHISGYSHIPMIRIRRFLYHVLFAVILFLLKTTKCIAQAQLTSGKNVQDLVQIAKKFEIAPMKQPSWAKKAGTPLFKVAWVSDMHLRDEESVKASKTAFNMIRDVLKADLTLITGDNCDYVKGLSAEEDKQPIGVRRHLWLKHFLEKELSRRYAIIPGDNWPWDFEKVFGPQKYSFDFGGVHFLMASTDAIAPQRDITSVFFDDTKDWIKKDLKKNAGKPSFFVLHETLAPPCFPDAEWGAATLSENPNVLAALCGHLHLDLEFPQGTWTQFCAPSIGRSHRPAFKLLNFYVDQVIIESYELQKDTGRIIKADKWQRIVIPRKFQSAIKSRHKSKVPLTLENRQQMPPRPKVSDMKLIVRAQEVETALTQFIIKFGLSKIGLTP